MKVVVMGPSQSGKSQLCRALMALPFQDVHQPTAGPAYFKQKLETVKQGGIFLEFWDMPAKPIDYIKYHLKDVDVVICVFDASSLESFNELQANYLSDRTLNPSPSLKKPSYLLVGTHRDQDELVPLQLIHSVANQHQVQYFSVSNSTTNGIAALFSYIKQLIFEILDKKLFHRQSLLQASLISTQTQNQQRLARATSECRALWRSNQTNIYNVRAILNDYAKQNDKWALWRSGHVNRHHTVEVASIVQKIDQDQYETMAEIIADLESIPDFNPEGSLAMRILFLKSQLNLGEIELPQTEENNDNWFCCF